MSLYELLKAAKIGVASDVLTTLRGRQAPFAKGGSTEKELEGVPPLSFLGNGEPLIEYNIVGASDGVGDSTSNIFDEIYPDIAFDVPKYISIFVGDGIYTLSSNVPKYTDSAVLFFLGGQVSSGASTNSNGVSSDVARTVTAINGYVTIAYRYYQGADPRNCQTMLNVGSIAVPYEPYGYKIPVTCGGETKTIYLDEPLGVSDSISMTDTGILIPTLKGQNTLSVGTTVQPSSVYIKYKG